MAAIAATTGPAQAKIKLLGENDKVLDTLVAQFNPSEFTTEHSARYSDTKPVADTKKKGEQFVAEENTTMRMRLTLDGFTKTGTLDPEKAADVSGDIKILRDMVRIDATLHKPPVCVFEWGDCCFKGYVTSLTVQYTMFASTGVPIRAAAEISMRSSGDLKIALESPDRTRRHILTQDTPLYMVAFEAYNNCAEWRRIATANGIGNPRRLRAGMPLRVPPMEKEERAT